MSALAVAKQPSSQQPKQPRQLLAVALHTKFKTANQATYQQLGRSLDKDERRHWELLSTVTSLKYRRRTALKHGDMELAAEITKEIERLTTLKG